jgi:hypothetical protein
LCLARMATSPIWWDNVHVRELGPVTTCAPVTTATSSHPGRAGTTPAQAHDNNVATFFNSSFNDWQHLQLSFSCVIEVAALRRHMTRDGASTSGNRGPQGEGFAYSLDGIHWVNVTAGTSSGWQNYVNIRPHAWHSLNYGWSAWLHLTPKIYARHIRFNWDGNGDAVNEIQVQLASGTISISSSATSVVGQ